DLGQHISSIVPIESDEKIISVLGIEKFDEEDVFVLTATKNGQIKQSPLAEYHVQRYSRPIKAMNVKKDDEMIFVVLITPEKELLLTTYFSYTLQFKIDEIPVTGVRTAGVKGLNLKEEDYLVSVNILEP